MKKRIKIQGFLIFLAVMMLVIFAKYLLPDCRNEALRMALDIIGAALFFSGYGLRIMARGYKAKLNPDGKTLVIDGPYAFSRNPMYLGTLLIGLGVILLLLKWWTGLIFLAIYLAIYIPQMRKEEVKLLVLFGNKFQVYCRQTPRFFPDIKSLLRLRALSKLKIEPGWIKKELSSIILALIFIICVKIIEFIYL